MKRYIATSIFILSFFIVSAAHASDYMKSFSAGNYTGTMTSVIPQMNDQSTNLEIVHIGNNVIGTLTFAGGKEVWTWNDKLLRQQEIDIKSNKVSMSYNADAAGAPTGTKQTYHIRCKNKLSNKCDADADSRNYWVMEGKPGTITYTVFGVDPAKIADKNLKATERHQFVFKRN